MAKDSFLTEADFEIGELPDGPDLGVCIGGFLPPTGDETELPAEPEE